MIPSLDDRLDSMARALSEVILPALPAERSMAIEQAHLVLAQIGVIREHLDLAPLFERREADEMIALGLQLCGIVEGGDRTMAAAAELRAAIDGAALATPAGVRLATGRIGAAIETLIERSRDDGSEGFLAASLRHVVAAGRAAARRDRGWNRSSGFEAADSDLPTITELGLAGGDAR